MGLHHEQSLALPFYPQHPATPAKLTLDNSVILSEGER
jgi:hypothetical protein